MNSKRKQKLNEYFDDILPKNQNEPHPFFRFQLHEIVRHPVLGYGLITGTRIPDFKREFEGLGVQYVNGGEMNEHAVYTPAECELLEPTGAVFIAGTHDGMTLEEVVQHSREDTHLPGLR